MRFILYFLALLNIIVLLFNWDNFTNKNFVFSDIQEGETLRLINEQQLPARALIQQAEIEPNRNPLANFIDSALDFLSSIGSVILDFFRSDNHPLPEVPPPP